MLRSDDADQALRRSYRRAKYKDALYDRSSLDDLISVDSLTGFFCMMQRNRLIRMLAAKRKEYGTRIKAEDDERFHTHQA